ncbi:MAG: Smr/MutS family protein, partial [Flammeovirgaceae bacterium]|nr:Smr/MutS family protein [Flammeovirgaceae bacterium]
VIDEKGVMRDNASPELSRIRQRINSEQNNLRKKLDQILRNFKSLGIAKDGVSATIREGRMVIPIGAEYKRKVKGFIHDTSATGQTVYIEPEEVLNINNEIRELELRERQEIIKILTKLTDKVRPSVESLLKANQFLGILDFIRAKAELGIELEAIRPDANNEPGIEWYHAFHPLLYLSYKKLDKKVVPQNIRLSEENRILLISGPNAGGKSVTLKTIGLIQYMFQCGLLVPILETSKMGFYKNIFMDIGDEQSLEDDLSTYSSHLTNMKHFVLHSNHRTLCLIDEFGSGTEPQLGAAIAESILESLNYKKAQGVITTHYANLKFYADRKEGLVNGAMRYDVEHLKPLYQLEIGKPGSSFALEIAENIGLPKRIVNNARKKVGSKYINIEKLLSQLEQEKKELQDKTRDLERLESQLKVNKDKYESLKDFQEQNKKKLLNEAKLEADRLLKSANQKIENTIRAIKENKAEKNLTKAVRKDLESFKKAIQPVKTQEKVPEEPTEEIKIIGGNISIGDLVKIEGQEAIGEVLEINNKDATVGIGELRTKIKIKRLVKVSRKVFKKQLKKSAGYTASININKKMAEFKPKIDLRGKRVEEALILLDEFMDEAIMLGQSSVNIVHGKGDGILRQVIRDHLRNVKEIKRMEDEHADRGGHGVTIVNFR